MDQVIIPPAYTEWLAEHRVTASYGSGLEPGDGATRQESGGQTEVCRFACRGQAEPSCGLARLDAVDVHVERGTILRDKAGLSARLGVAGLRAAGARREEQE